jgi:hypothetical protein
MKVFNTISLWHHVRYYQIILPGFTCPEEGCEMHFDKWSALRKHKTTEHKKMYPCEHCGKVLKQPIALKEHLATHSNSEAFHCPYEGCSRSYSAKRNLNTHVRTKHEGKTFPCTQDGCTLILSTKVHATIFLYDGVFINRICILLSL